MTSDWNRGNQNTDSGLVENSRTQNLIGRIGQMPQYPQPNHFLTLEFLQRTFPNSENSQMEMMNPDSTTLSLPPIRPLASYPTERFQTTINQVITNIHPVQFSAASTIIADDPLGKPLNESSSTTTITTPLAIENGSGRSINYMTPQQMGTLRKFPSNARSLIFSKVFDGVPVMYSSRSRQNNLRAVIRSPGYLCGCSNCNFENVVNAHELEIHAGCRQTKHPNDRIYFTNGKTIHDVVDELQATTTQELYQAMKTVSGFNINISNFSLWKDKHQAAMQRSGGVPDN